MGCRKAFEVDLPAFLAEARQPEFAEFREHYPRCPDCSAEVRAWTEVHLLLEAGGPGADAHPAEELLLQFEEDREALPAVRRKSIEAHLAVCRSCKDELAALRAMDFSRFEAAVGGTERGPVAPEPAEWPAERRERAPEPRRGRRSALSRLLSGFRGLALHPAFAYALVLLVLLYPTLKGVLEDSGKGVLEDSAHLPAGSAPARTVGEAPQAIPEADRRDARIEERAQRSTADAPKSATPPEAPKSAAPPAEKKGPARDERAGRRESEPKAPGARASSRLEESADEGRAFTAKDRAVPSPSEGLAPSTDAREKFEADASEPAALGVSRDIAPRGIAREEGAAAPAGEAEPGAPLRLHGMARKDGAAAPAGAPAGAGSSPADSGEPPFTKVLTLRQGEPVAVPKAALRGLLTLRVALPDAARAADEVEVRVLDPEGRREMRERVRPPHTEPYLDVRLPADWLIPGTYRVELSTIDAHTSVTRAFGFSFTVR
jgi:hypothetical protein